MLQIIVWGIAAGVALVGLNILQLALTANLPKKGGQIAFGIMSAMLAFSCAVVLIFLGNEQASLLTADRVEQTATPTVTSVAPDSRDWREQLRASDAAVAASSAAMQPQRATSGSPK